MKKIIVILLLQCLMYHSAVSMHKHNKRNSFRQDTLITSLASLDLASFYNKPIDSFIAKIPQGYQSMKVLGGSRDDRAGKLLINYNTNIQVIIRVLEFTHMDPTNPDKIPPEQRWSVTLMRKEKVYSIKIYNGTTLINHFNEDY